MVVDFDDFGADKVISDMCQSHDCRDALEQLKMANLKFKVTLFTIPGYMTKELEDWAMVNSSWVQLAWHGFFHEDNYECEKMGYQEFDDLMTQFMPLSPVFQNGFKAPGWQISDDIYKWLEEHNFWVADQDYNTGRRPAGLRAYINRDGTFFSHNGGDRDWSEHEAIHGHTWDCVGNGIYETLPQLLEKVAAAEDFKFISEVLAL